MTPVYLIVGEDELKRETAQKRLVSRFEQLGDIDFNMEVISGEKSSAEEVIAACNTMPFASSLRLVILKDVEKLSKEELSRIVGYCAAPCETTVLCLIARKLAKNTVLYKALSKGYPKSIIDCAPKSRRELPELVCKMALSHGVSIDHSAAELLIQHVGESTVRLDSELNKMAIALGGNAIIRESDIKTMVTRSAELKIWDLTDALSARDVKRVEEVLMYLGTTQSPFGLLALSVTRIRDLIAAKALEARGQGASLASVLGRPDWQVRNYRVWARNFTDRELREALHDAAVVEKKMKSGGDQNLALEMWLLSICS